MARIQLQRNLTDRRRKFRKGDAINFRLREETAALVNNASPDFATISDLANAALIYSLKKSGYSQPKVNKSKATGAA